MARRYMDFAPRKGGTAVKTRPVAKPQPEITIPEPQPVENEVPIRLMPNEKVVQRKVVRRTVTGVRAVPRAGTGAGVRTGVAQGVTDGVSKVRAVPRRRVVSGASAGVASGVASGAVPRMVKPQKVAATGVTRVVKEPGVTKAAAKPAAEPLQQRVAERPKVTKRPTQQMTTEPLIQMTEKPKAAVKPLREKIARSKTTKKPLQQRAMGLMRKRRLEMSEVPTAETMVDDPLERPVSEFADLEKLAQEIEEVTRGGVVDEETEFVSATESFSLKQQPRFGVVEDFQPRFLDTEVEKRPLSGGPMRSTGLTGVATEAEVTTGVTEMTEFETAPEENNVDASTNSARRTGTAATRNIGINGAETGETGTERNAGVNSAAMRTLAAKKAKMQIPNAKFINQNKVAKRPLSKTAYTEAGYGTVAGTTTGVAVGAKMAKTATGATGVKLAAPGSKLKGAEKQEIAVAKDKKKGGAFGMVIAIILTVILGAVVGTVAFLILPR